MSFYIYGMLSSSDLGHTCTLNYRDNMNSQHGNNGTKYCVQGVDTQNEACGFALKLVTIWIIAQLKKDLLPLQAAFMPSHTLCTIRIFVCKLQWHLCMHTRLSAIYSLCLHTSKRLQWFLESDTVLFIIGLWVQTSREGFMALKWPWHTGGTSK